MAKQHWYDQAVGAYEAAAIMGVHFTTPRKMVVKGLLTSHESGSVHSADPGRVTAIYDGREAQRDYEDYEAKVAARGGRSDRRPRGWLHLRPAVERQLRAVKTPIAFDDAITLSDAAELMGVNWTLVARMLREGKLVGRVAWTGRGGDNKLWIVSRKSVRDNIRAVLAAEAAGTKPGLKRKR